MVVFGGVQYGPARVNSGQFGGSRAMKCSNCSEIVRPVVAIDIDGTLGNYHGHFLSFAARWLDVAVIAGQNSEPYDGTIPFKSWFCDIFDTDHATFREVKLAYRQGGMKRTMPIYSGARGLVNELRRDAEVWLTTTRPADRYDRVDPDTKEWLRRHNIEYDGLLYSGRKMESLAEHVDPLRVCFVLDDLVSSLARAADLFPHASLVLRRTSWNRGMSVDVSTGDLLDARAMASACIQDWIIRTGFTDIQPSDFNNN
jgi:hypothetical protein